MKRLTLIALFVTIACAKTETPAPAPVSAVSGGDAARGKQLAVQYGCNVCHIIPGVEGPQGSLGPSLAGIGTRPAISFGAVKNTPENLAQFIQNPASVNPQSSMMAVGVTADHAKDIAAFLMTLK